MQDVVEGRATRESLWMVNDDVPLALPLDPGAVREKLHRDNRGVQIISAWLQEGGGTPGFFEVVNEFLRNIYMPQDKTSMNIARQGGATTALVFERRRTARRQ